MGMKFIVFALLFVEML